VCSSSIFGAARTRHAIVIATMRCMQGRLHLLMSTALLAACVQAGGGAVENPPMTSAPPPPPASSARPAGVQALLPALIDDAARRTGVAASAVRIASVATVTWRDAALGCPRADMAYAQVLVPGWRVLVTAGAQTLNYHASRRGQWLWCPADRVQEPLPGGAAT